MPVDVRVLPTAEATRSALETLVSGSDSVQVAAAFVRRSGVDSLHLLQRPPGRLLNVQITGSLHEPVAQELTGFFLRLWDSPWVVSLTGDVAAAYRADQRARERLWRQLRHSPEFRQAREIVQQSLLTHALGRHGRKWLLVTSEENYFVCLGRRRWGDEKYERIKQIRPGDLLIFYIKGVHKLGAVAMATTSVYRSTEATWKDRQYPYRIDFEILINPPAPVDIRPLIPQLEIFRGKEEKWGTVLQTSSRELLDADAHLLMENIRIAASAPDLRLVAEAPEDYGSEAPQRS